MQTSAGKLNTCLDAESFAALIQQRLLLSSLIKRQALRWKACSEAKGMLKSYLTRETSQTTSPGTNTANTRKAATEPRTIPRVEPPFFLDCLDDSTGSVPSDKKNCSGQMVSNSKTHRNPPKKGFRGACLKQGLRSTGFGYRGPLSSKARDGDRNKAVEAVVTKYRNQVTAL